MKMLRKRGEAETKERTKASAGAKALTDFAASAARLKSCPVTELPPEEVFPQPVNSRTRFFLALGFACLIVLVAGCHSAHIEVAVENRTGAPIRLLEVDYPNASFGADSLAADATFHYRIQVQGSGPVKVQYTAADGKQPQVQGPTLAERQEGTMGIVLLPGGKAEFHPHVSQSR